MRRHSRLFFVRPSAAATTFAGVLLLLVLWAVPTAEAQTYTYRVLYNFSGVSGFNPSSAVLLGNNGNIYGATQSGGVQGLGAVFTLRTSGEGEALYSFDGAGGSAGVGDISADADGDIFGTTFGGGTTDSGTVFRYNVHTRQFTMLYSFLGGTDGYWPSGGVIRDAAGNLYGTTYQGGDPVCSADQACGTVFKLDASGGKSILHNFVTATGTFPQGGLLRDADGNLYGAAANGGAHGAGVIYKIDPAGVYKVVYSFRGKPDGEAPIGRLICDNSHSLYGTTNAGGKDGLGTIFRLDRRTGNEKVLYSFTGGTDGEYPFAGLIQDANGNLFGSAYQGGDLTCNAPYGCGTVFKLDGAGRFSVLHAFEWTDGLGIQARLSQDVSGNLYGVTLYGGSQGGGVVFKLMPESAAGQR